MAKHLRGEIELEAHDLPSSAITPAQIKAIRLKVASSTKEFERLFGIPARTMESYEQGRRNLDGAMRALLRIIDREPKAACRALTRSTVMVAEMGILFPCGRCHAALRLSPTARTRASRSSTTRW
jgi:putative transcriptional regulator